MNFSDLENSSFPENKRESSSNTESLAEHLEVCRSYIELTKDYMDESEYYFRRLFYVEVEKFILRAG